MKINKFLNLEGLSAFLDELKTTFALKTHTHTKGDVGLGNVENKSSATIRGEITKANVTNALGYTPATKTSELTNDSGFITTSATTAKAKQLETSHKIDGMNFNGTADISHYGTCSTAASTVAKTVSLSGFNLVSGARVAVKFTVTNTAANPTLNVNGTGAKAIKYRGSAISAGYLAANRLYEFIYDGTDYNLVGDLDTNTTYSTMTAATSSAAGKSGLVPAPAAGKQGQYLRGDGTWATPTNTTYSNFVKSGSGAKAGLVPAPSTTAGTTKYLREDGTWTVPPNTWRGIQDNLTSTAIDQSLSANQGKVLNDSKLMHKTITTSKTDFDTLTETGIYHIQITTAVNAPSTNNGTLFVDTIVGTKYQSFMPDNVTAYMYKRTYNSTDKKWNSWVTQKFTDTNTTYSTGTASTSGLTKLYTGTGTATDGTMTQAAIQTELNKKLNIWDVGTYACGGSGEYWYCKVATIKITANYINRPIVFEISGRGKLFTRLTIMFNSESNTDPKLYSFSTNQENSFWIKKTQTSTWEVYGKYNEKYGSYAIHRVTGTGSNIGVTINMSNLSALPDGCTQASYVGNVNFANVSTKATQDSAGQQINTTYLKGLSISGKTITSTKGNGSTSTITLPTASDTADGLMTADLYKQVQVALIGDVDLDGGKAGTASSSYEYDFDGGGA